MRNRFFSCLFLMAFFPFAYGMDEFPHKSKPVDSHSLLKSGTLVFQAGGYWSKQGKAQHIDIEGLIGDDFSVDTHPRSNGLLGLGYFIKSRSIGHVQLSYGLNAFYLPQSSVSGIVTQEGLFENLSYDYGVTHWPIYAELQAQSSLESYFSYPLSLTMQVGIGPDFERTSHFAEHSLDGMTLPDNIFSTRPTTTFSATAGVGLCWNNVFGAKALECGYRFFYLGQGRFNKNTEQVLDVLSTGYGYANAAVCSIRI